MAQCSDSDDDEDSRIGLHPQEATSFSSFVSVRFLEDILHIYGFNVHSWAICQILHNCSVICLISPDFTSSRDTAGRLLQPSISFVNPQDDQRLRYVWVYNWFCSERDTFLQTKIEEPSTTPKSDFTMPCSFFFYQVVACILQRGRFSTLLQPEKDACESLLGPASNELPSNAASEASSTATFEYLLDGCENDASKELPYIECSFIVGFVAEVERMWSIAGNIITNGRKDLTPTVFESLLFLSNNRSYWDDSTIRTAMTRVRSERVSRSIREDEEQSDI